MDELRKDFERLYRQHFKPNGDHNTHSLEWVDHPLDLEGDEPHYLVKHTQLYWEFFQSGHAAGMERAAGICEDNWLHETAAAIRAAKDN